MGLGRNSNQASESCPGQSWQVGRLIPVCMFYLECHFLQEAFLIPIL